MSERLDLAEFLSAYLSEVDEHLGVANAKLLAIEASVARGEPSPRAVREVFRALHTIKGLSAMVGVEPVVAIAHRMEATLRASDRSGGALTAAAANTLLQGVTAIRHRVTDLSKGRTVAAPPPALLDALDALEPAAPGSHGSEPSPPTLDLDPALIAKLAPFELDQLLTAPSLGRRAVRVTFVPSPERAEKGWSITSVRDRVGVLAEIVKVVPVAIPVSDDSPGGLSFVLLLTTPASDDEIATAAGVTTADVLALVAVPSTPLAPPAPREAGRPAEDLDGDHEVDVAEMSRRSVLRVDVGRLDDAMERLSALIVTRSRLQRALAAMNAVGVSTRELAQVVQENARQLRDLRAALLRVRMVPMTDVLDRLPLLLRGLRRESGKRVRLTVEVGSAELDKTVAERIFPALVHLIRNAVDHAVELPDERLRLGKPEEATLSIRCTAHSNARLELSISDDGRGISRDDVARRRGRELGAGDAALLDAICTPGLSTRDAVTTTSGRGMGMDIVRRIIVSELGGELFLQTEAGVGTTFTLRVPLTISIVDAFALECVDQRFVVPVAMVDEVLDLDHESIRFTPRATSALTAGATLGARSGARYLGVLVHRGEPVPLMDLAAVLNFPRTSGAARRAVVVRRGGATLAFAVDRVLGQQETVVRPLRDPLVQSAGIAGATDLGDGKPTLVLDLVALGATLLERAREGERAA